MNYRLIHFTLLSAFLTVGSIGCSSTGATIKATGDANIIKLDDEFKILARLGKLPYEIKEPELIERFAIAIPGRSPEYLVVVMPKQAKGDINITTKDSTGGIKSAYQYNRYLDLILRAHRQVLKNDLNKALSILKEADSLFDETYASLVLQANIAIIQNRLEDANRNLTTARSLLPSATAIQGMFK